MTFAPLRSRFDQSRTALFRRAQRADVFCARRDPGLAALAIVFPKRTTARPPSPNEGRTLREADLAPLAFHITARLTIAGTPSTGDPLVRHERLVLAPSGLDAY